MKKIISAVCILILLFSACSCSSSIDDSAGKGNVSSVPAESSKTEDTDKPYTIARQTVVEKGLKARYGDGTFSISIEELIARGFDDYEIEVYNYQDAAERGYASATGDSKTLEHLKVFVVSGNVRVNPDVQHYVVYKEAAIIVYLIFDDNDNLTDTKVFLCDELSTCAALLMYN